MATLARMHVELVAKSQQFQKDMEEAAKRVENLGRSAAEVGHAMTKRVTAPLAAAGAAALGSAVQVGQFADRLLDLSEMTGLSTDELQRFRALAIQAGVSTDVIADSVQRLQVRMASGEEGSADLRMALTQLGIAMTDATGATRPMGQVVEEALAKLGDMEDVTARNVTAVRLFGRSASELAPVLGMGSDAMAQAIQRAEDLGMIMSGDALNAANDFRVEWDFMKAAMASAGRELGIAVMPVMRELVAFINDSVVPGVRAVIRVFGDMDPKIMLAVAGFAALVAAIGPVLVVAGSLVTATASITGALIALNGVLAAGGIAAMIAGGGLIVGFAGAAAAAIWLATKLRDANKGLEETSQHASTVQLNMELLAALGPQAGEKVAPAMLEIAQTAGSAADQVQRLTESVVEVTDAVVIAAVPFREMRVVLPEIEVAARNVAAVHGLLADETNRAADAQDRLNASMNKARGLLGALGSLGGALGFAIPGLGQAGGLLSAFSGFRGLFADGGTLGAGQWGIAGEAGPEIVHGPAQITPMESGPVNLSIQLVTESGRAITDRITYTAGRDDRRGRVIRVPLNAAVVTP
jgi:hypothetical protein